MSAIANASNNKIKTTARGETTASAVTTFAIGCFILGTAQCKTMVLKSLNAATRVTVSCTGQATPVSSGKREPRSKTDM